MEDSGQCHVPATLPLGKESSASTGYEAGWAWSQSGHCGEKKNVCTLLGIEAWLPGYEVLSFVTILTMLYTNSNTNVSMYWKLEMQQQDKTCDKNINVIDNDLDKKCSNRSAKNKCQHSFNITLHISRDIHAKVWVVRLKCMHIT